MRRNNPSYIVLPALLPPIPPPPPSSRSQLYAVFRVRVGTIARLWQGSWHPTWRLSDKRGTLRSASACHPSRPLRKRESGTEKWPRSTACRCAWTRVLLLTNLRQAPLSDTAADHFQSVSRSRCEREREGLEREQGVEGFPLWSCVWKP